MQDDVFWVNKPYTLELGVQIKIYALQLSLYTAKALNSTVPYYSAWRATITALSL